MPIFSLKLTQHEIKVLQNNLEITLAEPEDLGQDAADALRDVLTKVIVAQVEDDGPTTYERNHALESRFGPDAVE